MQDPLLTLRDVTVDFHSRHGHFRAVDSISFEIMPGEVLGVVGESGAGKSMTGSAIIGLIGHPGKITAGEIRLKGERIDNLPPEEMRKLRGKRIAMVMQDPLTSLNPLFTIGDQLIETIRAHLPLSQSEAFERAVSLLDETGIPRPRERMASYPHQFSGGMRQRVVIALALAAEPDLIIADEPTSALDVSVQAQILRLLRKVCDTRGAAVMMITHDMGAVAETADRMIVMNKGKIVEYGPVASVMGQPAEDYTRRLLSAIPSVSDPSRVPAQAQSQVLVSAHGLTRDFDLSSSMIDRMIRGRKATQFRAVDDVSFEIKRGTTFGLVGESGSGKSTCARMMVGLIKPTAGKVLIDGKDIATSPAGLDEAQMIFQDPYASLNPRWRIGRIIAEPIRAAGLETNAAAINDRVAELLRQVRLDPAAMHKFPHEFSGGQRQRIAIARALATQPRFIVCDEPTSALDVSVQAQVLDLMAELQDSHGLTYLLISHDLAVVKRMSTHVGVMQAGRMVEQGAVEQVFADPREDYTRMLMSAVPDINAFRKSA